MSRYLSPMRLSALALATITLAGCSKPPVEWGDITYENTPAVPVDLPAVFQSSPSAEACPGSLRTASDGRFTYATWWESRRDSSVVLMAARAVSDRRWSIPVIADSTDHGARGCGRPAPAIAADSLSGYVHVAYFAEPVNGGGVFFEHSMDSARTFHAAVPIVYGRNASRVSVAAHGNKVVVAYEDPNATQPVVGIGLSSTMGHIFEDRLQATSSNARAVQPVVRVQGDSIRLWWNEYSAQPTVSGTRQVYRSALWR